MTDYIRSHLESLALVQAACFKANNPEALRFFNYTSLEDYLLDRGVNMKSTVRLTDAELETVLNAACFSRLSFKPKECFHNAMLLAVHDRTGTISYCEGYCLSGAIPVHHAWNTINGKVVDLTRSLRDEAVDEFLEGKPPQEDLLDRVLGTFPEGWQYTGVEYKTDTVLSYIQHREQTGSLIQDHEGGFPLWTADRLGNSEPVDPDKWDRLTKGANKVVQEEKAHG